jgi:hypothetical protein
MIGHNCKLELRKAHAQTICTQAQVTWSSSPPVRKYERVSRNQRHLHARR